MPTFEYDPKSIAGQRVSMARNLTTRVLFAQYGLSAFRIVTTDESALRLGSLALRSGRSADAVAGGLADYLAAQAERAAKAARDKRNAQARARRARKKAEQ